jgi:hypothetical protein
MENLINIQHELKVPKGNYNSFGKYKYRSAEDILSAVKPYLFKYKCLLYLDDDVVLIGNKYFVKATATFTDIKYTLQIHGFAEITEHKGMSAEQCVGTASSYARKYALNGLFNLDETEADADSREPVKTKNPEKPQNLKPVDFTAQIENMINCKTLNELQLLYLSFTTECRNNPEVIKTKDNLKLKFNKV